MQAGPDGGGITRIGLSAGYASAAIRKPVFPVLLSTVLDVRAATR